MTIGSSVIAANPSPSTIRENPPPDVATILLAPAKLAPIAIFIAEISSSVCFVTILNSLSCSAKSVR